MLARQTSFLSQRVILSFASILVGVSLLGFVFSGGLDSSTTAPRPSASVPPLVKGTPADCPPFWRFLDNPQARFTVCAPVNLVYYDNARAVDLNLVGAVWPAQFAEFQLANQEWLAATTAASENAALEPLQIKIEVVPAKTQTAPCAPEKQLPGPGGLVACSDAYRRGTGGELIFDPGGDINVLSALLPTLPGKTVAESFSFHVSIASYRAFWLQQESMFRLIISTLRPY